MRSTVPSFALVLFSLSCGDAQIGSPGASQPVDAAGDTPPPGLPPSDPPPSSGGDNDAPCTADIAPRAWRLNAAQYRETVMQLFDEGRRPELDAIVWPFTGEDNLSAESFSTLSSGPRVVAASFDRAVDAAETIADALVTEAQRGDGCMSDAPLSPGCVETFVLEAAEVLHRRPDVRAHLEDKLSELSTVGPESLPTLAEEMIFSLLMSPRFLFRMELGTDAVSAHELAERLSYSLTDAPPDAELLEHAVAGTLSDPAVLEAQVERLLFTPRGLDKATKFIREYVRYDKLFTVDPRANQRNVPSFHPADLVEDTDALVRHLLQAKGKDGFLRALFSTDAVFAQKQTLEYYTEAQGVDLGGTSGVLSAYDGERHGILTQPSWLVSFSQGHRNDPIERGRFIREQILCGQVPEIAISDVEPVPEDPTVPLALRLRTHTSPEDCSQCHRLMDDLGLAFEQYDHYGRFRTHDGGQIVDASGVVVSGGDAAGAFADTAEFTARLAHSQTVSECFSKHAFAFYLGRELETDELCLARRAEAAFTESAQSLPSLLTFLFQQTVRR